GSRRSSMYSFAADVAVDMFGLVQIVPVELRDSSLRHRPFCRHVTFGGALLVLLGVGPFDGAISHPDRFGRKLIGALGITVLNHTADQNFLELDLHVLDRLVAAGAPEFDCDFRYVGSFAAGFVKLWR